MVVYAHVSPRENAKVPKPWIRPTGKVGIHNLAILRISIINLGDFQTMESENFCDDTTCHRKRELQFRNRKIQKLGIFPRFRAPLDGEPLLLLQFRNYGTMRFAGIEESLLFVTSHDM